MNNQKKLVNINKIEYLLVKINTLKNIISKTITSSQKYKLYDILGANEVNVCISTLDTLFNDIKYELEKINTSKFNLIETTNKIQKIEDELLLIVKNFGTDSLADLIYLLFGDNYIDKIESDIIDKYNLLLNKAHPINYKILPWKPDTVPSNKKQILKNKIVEDNIICESGVLLDCFDLARTSKSFQTKVYGIKLCLHDYENKRTYLVACLVDDILISCVENLYLKNKFSELESNKPKDIEYENDHWQRFIESLTIKDILVYSVTELAQRFISILNQLILIKQKTITQVVKEFLSNELYAQRTTLIQLLIQGNQEDFQYLAYLLYDLLSNENNSSIDTLEQTLLYDSLPWNTKKFFKVAMKQTIQYTNTLCNYDSDKIPLEQQICLLKASDSVKEKAILKLKEIKAKSEDTGSKARQYLDGLLKIPFSIMREEPCLNIVENNQQIFQNIIQKLDQNKDLLSETKIPDKQRYTNHEILRYIDYIKNNHISSLTILSCSILEACIKKIKKDDIITIVSILNNIIKTYKLPNNKIHYSNKKISQIQNDIIDFININANNFNVINNIWINIDKFITSNNPNNIVQLLTKDIYKLEKNISFISEYISKIKITLNSAVHGHDKAKRQVERIVGQWINGEKGGYCFGFEGPAGVGKTSLAKRGLARCLKDENGVERPFAFIAIGGSANGSTLEGHNYTYVGSTWGRIVDILIESKCMNPIIFIDELDKISRTEHGKEIIGILTHLIDPTQNDTFQDKYFSGIDLDLSKVLFIFSYNDVDSIDRILLDRIHRIKFKNLAVEEKLVITNNYILPEIYKKMGLENVIDIDNNVIEYIISNYTKEPGVRKLKEILFEIIAEINLSELANINNNINYPIKITIEDIKYKYLKDRHEFKIKQIFNEHKIGLVSGLWANNYGQGGLLPIETKFLPSSTFLELKLTGMQGDVMKESMNVAKTVAWNLLSTKRQNELLEKFEKNKSFGIHIHVPEGATPKDGPSGGAAITTVIYSLLSDRKINRNFAMTGEICLQGRVTAIGGLDLKILGGIESGVTHFIYPKENDKDFKEFEENLKNKSLLNNIKFTMVSSISEVFDIIFVD
jgi:endopeptidase La